MDSRLVGYTGRPVNPGVRRLPTIPGQAPRPGAIRTGCVFAPRCAAVQDLCLVDAPPRLVLGEGHEALCAFPLQAGRPS